MLKARGMGVLKLRYSMAICWVVFFAIGVMASNAFGAAPVVSAGGTLEYTEGDGAVAIDTGITVTDGDSTNLEGATVTVSGGYQSGEDVLGFVDGGGISGSFNAGIGVLTLTGTAAVSAYQSALRSVTYSNTSEDPTTGARTIRFVVNDGDDSSDPDTSTITVSAENDAPEITGQANPLSTPEETALTITLGDLAVTDPDNTYPDDFTLTVIDGPHYSVTGTTITPGNNYVGTLTVPVKVNDGEDDSNTYNLSVTVTAENDAPEITGQANPLSTPEETP